MNRSIRSTIGAALLAIGALGVTAAANASTDVYFSVGVPVTPAPVYVQPQPVYVPPARIVHVQPRPVYEVQPAYSYDDGYEYRRAWRQACGAPRWDPDFRYMPGHTVWRYGTLYVARGASASVWNENSPPELTPQLWRPVRCR